MSAEEATVFLSGDELGFLQFVSNIAPEPESPLARVRAPERADETRAGREALIHRRLVDPKSLRPNRDLERRLLIVSEPDAHVRLTSSGKGEPTVLVDAYERAGVRVRLESKGGGYALSPADTADELRDAVTRHLPVRRSAGDFARFELSAEEYMGFCLLAARCDPNRRRGASEPAVSSRLELGLRRLVDMDLAFERGGRFELRPFLGDLGRALADRRRLQLARTDFGIEEWMVRDVTFVAVPGSVFQLQVQPKIGIIISELDGEGLQLLLEETLITPSYEESPELSA